MKNYKFRPIFNIFKRTKEEGKTRKTRVGKEGIKQIKETMKEVNEYFHKNIPFQKKLQKYIPRINLFKLISVKNTVLKLFKQVSFNEFKKFMGINKTNKIVGFTPDYTGYQPGKKVNNDKNIYLKFVTEKYNEILQIW